MQPLLSQLLLVATPSSLQLAQRVIYNAIVDHYSRVLSVYSPEPLLVNINNKAGTGKSYFITVLSRTLNKLAAIASKLLPLVRAAPTSVIAFGINGQLYIIC